MWVTKLLPMAIYLASRVSNHPSDTSSTLLDCVSSYNMLVLHTQPNSRTGENMWETLTPAKFQTVIVQWVANIAVRVRAFAEAVRADHDVCRSSSRFCSAWRRPSTTAKRGDFARWAFPIICLSVFAVVTLSSDLITTYNVESVIYS